MTHAPHNAPTRALHDQFTQNKAARWSDRLEAQLSKAQQERDDIRAKRLLTSTARHRDFATFGFLSDAIKIDHSQPLNVWKAGVWQRQTMCNVCLKATTPGYARLECMSCDVVVH
eukprot:9682-Heterococcus_DN1.PRE.3